VTAPAAQLPSFDTGVPALLLRSSPNPWDYGGLATIRTLGRAGIAVHAFVSPQERPLLASRYLAAVVGPCLDVAAGTEAWVAATNAAVAEIGGPVVAVPCDDETAVFLAEHRDVLDDRLLTFPVPANLPRQLSSKSRLAELCEERSIGSPRTEIVHDRASARAFAAMIGLPLIAKNPETFSRLDRPAVERTTIVPGRQEVEDVLAAWDEASPLLLQEYIPRGDGQEWYVAGVIGPDGTPLLAFAGRKMAAYPAGTGVGIVSQTAEAPELVDQTLRFAQQVGFVGAFDTDWLRGSRGDVLLDFNPRRGAQFRLFGTDTGVDVVLASHLALTGRTHGIGAPVSDRSHQVGNLRLMGMLRSERGVGLPWVALTPRQRRTRQSAWWAWDDPRPAMLLANSMVSGALGMSRTRNRDGS
jgi:D-aspartate ligase